jgi:hypothetical protein
MKILCKGQAIEMDMNRGPSPAANNSASRTEAQGPLDLLHHYNAPVPACFWWHFPRFLDHVLQPLEGEHCNGRSEVRKTLAHHEHCRSCLRLDYLDNSDCYSRLADCCFCYNRCENDRYRVRLKLYMCAKSETKNPNMLDR